MQKSIHFETPVTLPLAISVVMIALEKTQKTYTEKNKPFHFKELNDFDLLEKKIEVIVSDDHSNLCGITILLRIRMIKKDLPIIMQIVPSMRVRIDDDNLNKEIYKPVINEIVKRIEDMIKFVDMSCDNI